MSNTVLKRFKHTPLAAAMRKELAATYRAMRKDNPAMARLLFSRMESARADLKDWMIGWRASGLNSSPRRRGAEKRGR